MAGKLFYVIPDDLEIMIKLIEATPATWLCLSGTIRAPEALIVRGLALEETGFYIGRFHSIRPTIIGRYDPKGRIEPDLFGMLVEQKLPGFVQFDQAGDSAEFITLTLAKFLAQGFVVKGYRGHLTFVKSIWDNDMGQRSARYGLSLVTWESYPKDREFVGMQPPLVTLEGDGRYGGKEADIESLFTVCRFLGLKEYKPQLSPS
ncbi:MAG: hypothetical protein Q7S03_04045 [bacterium]|nr:hypothetical protein [bacterium]